MKRQTFIESFARLGSRSPGLVLALFALRCGSEPAPSDHDDGRFGPPGGVVEVDPSEIPLAGSGGVAGGSGKGGANTGGKAGSSASGGPSGGSGGVAGSAAGRGGNGGAGGSFGSAGLGGSSGASGSIGSGGVSSQPPATFTQTTELDGLELVSSNLVQEVLDLNAYQEWFGEIANGSSQEACFVEASITFLSESGAAIIAFDSFADGPPYEGSLSLSVSCIPPGETAGIYSNALGAVLELADIREARVELSYLDGVYVPHPSAPIVTRAEVVPGLFEGTWSVSGTMLGVAPIYNIGMYVYPRDPITGLLVARLTAANLEPLGAGATWDYETSTWQGPEFARFLQAFDFIAGVPRVLPPPADERARRMFDKAERRRQLSLARDDRRAFAERRALAR